MVDIAFITALLAMWVYASFVAVKVFVLEREPPVTIITQDLAYDSTEQGGTIQIATSVVRHRPCLTTTVEYIKDAQDVRFDLPATTSPLVNNMGYDSYKRSVKLDDSIAPGPATLYISAVYNCHYSHIWWPLIEPVTKLTFTVKPRGEK